ncbi:serine hydrolase domain-containing protein [Aquimarina algicola]|uniref:Beta-lactamase family protein n=1 Tax=Aquimarina algicola TaxID=2589995 RepID=A0A504JQ96_9FLAO|nr:serine hydrolase domain-containing protein [Aquimarina algicola]TPN88961.1 beta-lactamase family protein [Aquimarina algicola]
MKYFKQITVLFFVSTFILGCARQPQKKDSTSIEDTIDTLIEEALQKHNISALSIGYIQDGKIKMLKGYGVLSKNNDSTVDENSIYQIASQSKMFTGIIANRLINENKLELTASIVKYLKEDLNKEAQEKLRAITLKNLIQHTSGIPGNVCLPYKLRKEGDHWADGYTKEELIQDLNTISLEFEPGTKFQYSNSGYAILGYICEKVSGEKYETLLTNYITKEYRFKNTVVSLDNTQKTLLVTPYRKDNRTIETKPSVMGMATPASAIYSNAKDLTQLLQRQLKSYRDYYTSKSSFLVLTHHTADMGKNLEYGFGLIKQSEKTYTKYGHGGDADGFACEYFFIPEQNKGLVLLTSSGGKWLGELAESILTLKVAK